MKMHRKFTSPNLDERFMAWWTGVILPKYAGIWQRSGIRKQNILIAKFMNSNKQTREERVLSLADTKFRKKFKLDENKRRFVTTYKLLQNFNFGK